jgi:hypothetical protein
MPPGITYFSVGGSQFSGVITHGDDQAITAQHIAQKFPVGVNHRTTPNQYTIAHACSP